MGPAHRVLQEFPEAEAPSFHAELRGCSHTGGRGGVRSTRTVGWVAQLGRAAVDPLSHPELTWVRSWPSRCHHL